MHFHHAPSRKLKLSAAIALAILLFFALSSNAFAQDPKADFGDLPLGYNNTLEGSFGASHDVDGLFLGATVDAELDGFPSVDSNGDDFDFNDDEDGVDTSANPPTDWVVGPNGASVDVTASGDGCLNVWIDLNNDYQFQPSEHVVNSLMVMAGSQTVSFDVSELNDFAYARFRLTPKLADGSCAPIGVNGPVFGGEVEDYLFIFVDATAVGLNTVDANSASLSIGLIAIATLGLAAVTGVTVRREN